MASILLVDDEESARATLALLLKQVGHDVVQAEGAAAAAEALTAAAFDLVITDLRMPEGDGLEVVRRTRGTRPDAEVIVLTAYAGWESAREAMRLGAFDYSEKGREPDELLHRIDQALEKNARRRENEILRDQEARHLRELAEWNARLEQRVEEQVAQVERLGRLKRFFSPQLAELIVAGGADDPLLTHRREVTVVFLDLRGFTAFAETSEPEVVMGVLRDYHAEMGRLILEHEGTLERFTGDGMMIFFNDPVPVPNPAERAILMAVAMRERIEEQSEGWRKRGWDLALGVGIAQGYATIGAIGFEGRWDYGAIGTVTNLAARLCGEARSGQILVSSRVATAVEGLIEAEAIGPLALKGLLKPVSTFSVLGLKGSSGAR
jgi:class 3 adenylate cyclase/CheY-like chemotaxis protein